MHDDQIRTMRILRETYRHRNSLYTLKPYPLIHALCASMRSLHLSPASSGSVRRKQSSRFDLVSGHAQHLSKR